MFVMHPQQQEVVIVANSEVALDNTDRLMVWDIRAARPRFTRILEGYLRPHCISCDGNTVVMGSTYGSQA